MSQTVADTIATESETDAEQSPDEMVDEELLVEEISIDGMCGVY